MLGKMHYIKINVQKFPDPKKVKCPKKEKKETKYTLAFHAEGKNPRFFESEHFLAQLKSNFKT